MPDTPDQPRYVPGKTRANPLATRLVAELKHDRGILTCRYDPTNQFLFAGARDNFVHRWDLAQKPVIDPDAKPAVPAMPADARRQLEAHQSWAGGLSLFNDGDRLASGDFVGQLVIWKGRSREPKPQFSFEAHTGSIRKVSVSPDGNLIATAGNDGVVRVWNTDAAKKLHLELIGHDCHVYHVAFHPDGKNLVSADLKGRVKHWNVESGRLVRELDASLLHTYSEKYEVDVGGIRGMTFNKDGSKLACAGATGDDRGIAHSGDARVLLFDWDSGLLQRELRPEKKEVCTAWGVLFHPDGFIVGSGGSRTGGFLWFWTPDRDTAFHVHKFRQRAPGFDVDLSPNQRTLAVADHDGSIRLYEMSAKEESSEQKAAG